MPVESAADRAVFFNAAEFGVVVTYTSIETGLPIQGISAAWFEPSASVGLNEISTDTTRPELTFRAIDIPEPREGDVVRRESDGRTMQISPPIQPDGEGFITCALVEMDC